jgi:hypothetical protein
MKKTALNILWVSAALVLLCCISAAAHSTGSSDPSIRIDVDKIRVGMGRPVDVHAQVTLPGGKPAVNYLLLPYVNGKRWGAHEYTDAQGKATFMIPLPNVGVQEIQVRSAGLMTRPTDQWIWGPKTEDHQVVYMQKTVYLPNSATKGELYVAVDDHAIVYLNGTEIYRKDGWGPSGPYPINPKLFRKGENVIAVTATNDTGPAALALRLEMKTPDGMKGVGTDSSWKTFDTKPDGFPGVALDGPSNAVQLGNVADQGAGYVECWPGMGSRAQLITRSLKPAEGCFSNTVQVRVDWRKLHALPRNPDELVGVQWEEWFTPTNCYWQTAQAVPLMGFYESFDPDVLRQQAIWLTESGADFIVADWSNNIWNIDDWDKRAPGFNELQLSTTMMLETLAKLRDEGHDVPKFTLLTGVSNVPNTGVNAVNGQLNYIYRNYIDNPRFKGLWQEFDGKPLVTILDCSSSYARAGIKVDDRFTVRYVGSVLELSHADDYGLWSWMDGTLKPILTYKDGKKGEGRPEATTVSVGFFGDGGWKYPAGTGRKNGSTLLETFKVPYAARPRVTFIHQFNEFAGQTEGQGFGPKHDVYVDSYSTELSDDAEPTSLTTPAYRGNGGWGYLYLNYMRALVDLYRQKTPVTTVLAVSNPVRNAVVKAGKVKVEWTSIGKPAASYTVRANGEIVVAGIKGNGAEVDLSKFPAGPLTISVVGEGTKANYRYSWTDDSERLSKPIPAASEVQVVLEKK